MNNIKKRNELLAHEVVNNLKKRHFDAYYAQNKEQALKKAIELIKKDDTISWGGSITLDEIGIKEYLRQNSYKIIDRDSAKTPEQRKELILKSITCDTFLMSTNAISYEGELVNIDGHGNRLSALCYGAKSVIVILGVNKIQKTLEDAISRARNHAAPINAQRISNIYEIQTPCLNSGRCFDCKSPTSICAQILITRLSFPQKRIKVIIVNEQLGY